MRQYVRRMPSTPFPQFARGLSWGASESGHKRIPEKKVAFQLKHDLR
jgi:hypothetical protein